MAKVTIKQFEAATKKVGQSFAHLDQDLTGSWTFVKYNDKFGTVEFSVDGKKIVNLSPSKFVAAGFGNNVPAKGFNRVIKSKELIGEYSVRAYSEYDQFKAALKAEMPIAEAIELLQTVKHDSFFRWEHTSK